ncbi:unnamed protein product [Acanthoscelides obtectus]|uniref:Uncharacterized protein n=1 Tax=Acanthoscelides obtectus TaxID=200917 RepID=A0A9P0JJF0_ACAOB|nr:unnamed protein product [Acanthoscelides obtectus]CAK1678825.1 hypothetical protein AOBTE_LOCUS32035 [Acanthoscelides obtectus]
MKILIFCLVSYICLIHSWATVTSNGTCRCHRGFIATPGKSGEYMCYGLYLKIIMPCNTPEYPLCKCTNATAVVVDATGPRCSKFKTGKESEKWPCENTEEWAVFKERWAIMFRRSAIA